MNLLPIRLPRDMRPAGGSRSRRFGVLTAGLFLGSSLALVGMEVRSLNRRLQAARIERDRLVEENAEREHSREQVRSAQAQLARLRAIEGRLARWQEDRLVLPDLLRGLSAVLPDVVVLEAFRREGPELRITGRGDSAAAVTEAAAALSRLERVRDLELLWVEQVEGATGAAEQRFSLAGAVRYGTREPPPFDRIETAAPFGERGS